MKAVEVHNLEDAQLVEFADNARKELFNLRFQHATGQLENTARLKAAKADLARVLTTGTTEERAAARAALQASPSAEAGAILARHAGAGPRGS